VFILPCLAADDPSQARERTRDMLLYGIDSQVLEVVQKLKATADTSYSVELAAVLAEQRGVELRRGILDFFTDTRTSGGEQAATEILKGWQDAAVDLAIAAVRYLSAIEAKGRAALFAPLLDAPQPALASAAIRGLGKTGDPSVVELLLKNLAGPDAAEAARGDLILALGDLGDARAVQPLIAIAKNRDEEKSRRMYAAASLGRLGDAAALPVLRDMFVEKDALLKASAAAALSRFSVQEAFDLLLAGLKDENWKVRVECAKALTRPLDPARAEQALAVLFYKGEFDPATQVRTEAVRAIGAIGGEKALRFLAGLFRDVKNPLAIREESLTVAARAGLPAVLEAVRAVIAEEWKAVDQRTLEMTARVISGFSAAELHDTFSRLLESPNPIVRIYGVRAIAAAAMRDLRERIVTISKTDPHTGVQREAAKALEKL